MCGVLSLVHLSGVCLNCLVLSAGLRNDYVYAEDCMIKKKGIAEWIAEMKKISQHSVLILTLGRPTPPPPKPTLRENIWREWNW